MKMRSRLQTQNIFSYSWRQLRPANLTVARNPTDSHYIDYVMGHFTWYPVDDINLYIIFFFYSNI